MRKLIIELGRGLKWVFSILGVLATLVFAWLGCAWCIGWGLNHYFDLKNVGPQNFRAMGSCAMGMVLIVQVVVLVLIAWILNAVRQSRGLQNPNLNKKG